MENIKEDWMLTDGDSFQIVRKRPDLAAELGDSVYELYQLQSAQAAPCKNSEEHTYYIAHDFICADKVDVDEILECYGYESLEEVKSLYPEDWQQILAECAFELKVGCYINVYTPILPWEKAVSLLKKLSGYGGSL